MTQANQPTKTHQPISAFRHKLYRSPMGIDRGSLTKSILIYIYIY